MSGQIEDLDRQVVPRWRSFDSTQRHGELSSFKKPSLSKPTDDSLQALVQDWRDRPGPLIAADLVSSAVLLGKESVAADAAHFLLNSATSPIGSKRISALCLMTLGEPVPHEYGKAICEEYALSELGRSSLSRKISIKIHETRGRLTEHPRSPVLWNNLARLYTTVGSSEKADRAMKVALTLAPENRLILRGTARMFLHEGRGHEAHRLLTKSQNLLADPWVLSAEIATAAAIKHNSKYVKTARKIIESGRFSPLHLSELASALGTLEAAAGNRKGARKLIEFSLRNPSENAIAQAAWLSRTQGICVSLQNDETNSAEANSLCAYQNAHWQISLDEAIKWQTDQPFSSRPAILGSHVAATLQDFRKAKEIAELGLLANPDDPSIINNWAFALVLNGEVEKAIRALNRVNLQDASSAQLVALTATRGLAEFRAGHPVIGRSLYHRAIELASATRERRGLVARIYLALEELRIGSPEGMNARDEALAASKDVTEPWVAYLRNRLECYQPETRWPIH